jgi:probable phosphoglycerate mutase
MSKLAIRLIRHGVSQSNAGLPTNSPVTVSLTLIRFEQAFRLASEADKAPELIIVSSYLRTHQTAAPMMARFPQTKVVQWSDLREFTYLAPANYSNTTAMDRKPYVEEYWRRGDAKFVDGEGAESFDDFISRVKTAIGKLEELHGDGLKNVYLFGHGLFLVAMKHVLEGNLTVGMPAIYSLSGSIENAEGYRAIFDGKDWRTTGSQE